jgi:hypothetical protein
LDSVIKPGNELDWGKVLDLSKRGMTVPKFMDFFHENHTPHGKGFRKVLCEFGRK